jgi:hypothetical protein
MQKPQFLVLENPGTFESLDEATAEKFEAVERKTLPLLEKIINGFESANKERVGYTNNYRPKEKEVVDEYRYGDIKVFVKTKLTTLRTDYKTVVEEVEKFLKFVAIDYLEARARKGVLTIDGEAYVGLSDVIDKVQELKDTALEGKEGINQSVRCEAPENVLGEGLDKVVFKLGKDYSELTQENAVDYARASILSQAIIEQFYSPFTKTLKQRTGYDNENPPSASVQEFVRAGNYLFPVQVTPKETPKYGKVIEALIQPFNKRVTKNTGELIKLKEGFTDETLARYAPKTREGQLFIRLETLQERMSEIKADCTETSCAYKIERSIRIA